MSPEQIISESLAILQRSDPNGAEASLARLGTADSRASAAAKHLLGLIRQAQHRFADAEILFRQAVEDEPNNANYHNSLGLLLKLEGSFESAIESFKEAVRLSPKSPVPLLNLSRALDASDSAIDAEAVARQAISLAPTTEAYTALGSALRKQARYGDALVALDRALELNANYAPAAQARAITLDKAGSGAEAAEVFAKLHATGLKSQDLFLTWARTLIGLGRLGEAESVLAEGLRVYPARIRLHQSLARVRWLRGDKTGYARDFEAAVSAEPSALALRIGCADLLRLGDRHEDAERLLRDGLIATPDNLALRGALGVLCTDRGDCHEALEHLRVAADALPHDWALRESLLGALLQAGAPEEALSHIRAARAARPLDAAWIAHEAVALRMLGDPGYTTLYDFDRMVKPFDLPTPEGFASSADFIAAFAVRLRELHQLPTHPIDQSLRHGTQTPKSLLEVDDPLIHGFFASVDKVVSAYIGQMPDAPEHPFFGRKPVSGRGTIASCWSVRLRPGGFHMNHVHPEGWISSAFYVSVPPSFANADDKQGWIQFGEPRWPLPGIAAERFVEPRQGRLVLFPSSMWHGTVPFRTGEERLTVAFDIVPA